MKVTSFITTRNSNSQSEDLSFNDRAEKTQSNSNHRNKQNRSSDTQRATLKKSVTFASVFDSIGNEYDLVGVSEQPWISSINFS